MRQPWQSAATSQKGEEEKERALSSPPGPRRALVRRRRRPRAMLAADKQLLDAHLRNELQQLRRLEITNVVNRYQSALTPATLIAGFSMVGMSALDFTSDFQLDPASKYAEPVFYAVQTSLTR